MIQEIIIIHIHLMIQYNFNDWYLMTIFISYHFVFESFNRYR